ncbi:hypothetical protein G210_0745 [Candida maltosa Xu316]|uniref:Tr-type G domain-containing protein n=1 Tax=Candida maltosa (strain Xu316) TaxID=1245528 RepID=M3IVX3_CANMX|nr:hypothetical protein G210_0745 [Candida maltosa Xu316]
MDEDDDIYDEFGNLIENSSDEEFNEPERDESQALVVEDSSKSLIKSSIPTSTAETIYIDQVVSDETNNNNLLDEPVIKPINEKKFKVERKSDSFPNLIYSRDYLVSTMNSNPDRIRNFALVGDIGSGKTSLVDLLVKYTHSDDYGQNFEDLKFMDNYKLEIERGLTIKSNCISLLLPDSKGRSFVLNIVDTPGVVVFNDEVMSSLNLVDGVVLILDLVNGLTSRDKMLIDLIIQKNLHMVIVLNKLDKLILELRLPLKDCYLKMNNIIEDVNEYISSNSFISGYKWPTRLSPELGNVLFSSCKYNILFNLKSFGKFYNSSVDTFSSKLWGDIYYNPKTNKFTRKSTDEQNSSLNRSFVSFILEPIYKVFTHTLTSSSTVEDYKKLSSLLWSNFKVSINKSDFLKNDIDRVLKIIFKSIFNNFEPLVDTITTNLPTPHAYIQNRRQNITTNLTMLAEVTKLIESTDGKSFDCLVRVYTGSIKPGDQIKVYGENYNEDKEDFRIETVDAIYLPGGRYKVPLQEAKSGSIIIVGGIDSIIRKGASLTAVDDDFLDTSFDIPKYSIDSVFKVAIEPLNPSELPLLLEGLRKINKSYLSSVVNVEESGEHVLLAPGELYMDCVLHDLRFFFNDDLQIKVSDPMAKFSETCIESSFINIPIYNNDDTKDIQISIVSEPLDDDKLSNDIQTGKLNINLQKSNNTDKKFVQVLKNEYNWDSLAARSVWSFGPSDLQTPDVLVDDTLSSDKSTLESFKNSIVQGFNWSVNQGPLCDEPIRNTKFKILDLVLNNSDATLNSSQIIPMSRRACYTGFLTAKPRLMEPIYKLMVKCTYKSINVIKQLLSKRRGFIDATEPIAGTPFFQVLGYVPVIDSVGLSTDIQLHCSHQARCI